MTETVRDATEADIEAIRSVAGVTWWDTYEDLCGAEWIESHLAEFYDPALIATQLAEAAGAPDCHFLVAESGDRVVGYLHFQQLEDRGPYLRRLYVEPDAQRSGVGRILVAELHRRLGRGASYQLDLHPDNVKAVSFYRSLGGEWTGERLEPCWELMRIDVA